MQKVKAIFTPEVAEELFLNCPSRVELVGPVREQLALVVTSRQGYIMSIGVNVNGGGRCEKSNLREKVRGNTEQRTTLRTTLLQELQ